MGKPLKAGKLEIDVLRRLLKEHRILDPRVIVGPEIGEDAAVIDPGGGTDYYWVVTADPITFATEEIGHYGVIVNMNDIATRGAIPKWFLATLLFPEGRADLKLVDQVFRQVHQACSRFGISLIGGHSEITSGIDRVILSGHMIGEVRKERLVTTSGARSGDLLLLVKGVCIEGTSIIAREMEADLLKRGVSSSLIQRAKAFLFDPGIDVLRAARLACESASVHSMHDPTEGGLISGVLEMALASGKTIEVDMERILVYEESRILCAALGLDPLRVIASGALLLTISPSDLSTLEPAFEAASVPVRVIGRVKEGPARIVAIEGGTARAVESSSRDEILKICDAD